MSLPNRTTWRALVFVIFSAAVIALGAHAIFDGHADTVTVSLGGPGPTTTVTTTPAALAQVKQSEVGDHAGARDENPPGVADAKLVAGRVQQSTLAKRDHLPLGLPDAAPVQRGCRSRFVRNYSSRHGVAPRLWVPHYTVSSNRPGWSDVNAIVALFDRSAFAASSTYVMDRDGNCAYIVREGDKPWTQAFFNPLSISVEIINTGHEPPLFTPSGLRKFARVASDSARRWHIPIRRGKTSGCRLVRSGFADHNDLGACGGGHFDVTPYRVETLIAAVRRYRSTQTLTARRCRELTRTRRSSTGHRWTPAKIERAQALKHVLGTREVRCR